jgi:cell division septation protein DedD
VEEVEPAPSVAKETVPPTPSQKPAASAIEEELRLHKSLSEPPAPEPKPGEAIRSKPVTDQAYFAVQVGAFGNFQNAKTYANRFNTMGYKTEIVSSEGGSGTLYRVWVGRYPDRNQAMQEKDKLEKVEKKKFSLVSNRR